MAHPHRRPPHPQIPTRLVAASAQGAMLLTTTSVVRIMPHGHAINILHPRHHTQTPQPHPSSHASVGAPTPSSPAPPSPNSPASTSPTSSPPLPTTTSKPPPPSPPTSPNSPTSANPTSATPPPGPTKSNTSSTPSGNPGAKGTRSVSAGEPTFHPTGLLPAHAAPQLLPSSGTPNRNSKIKNQKCPHPCHLTHSHCFAPLLYFSTQSPFSAYPSRCR